MVQHDLRRLFGALVLISLISFNPSTTQSQTTMIRPTNLRCEFLVDPLGIDIPRPRLSWTLESERRGEFQTAYRILVATSASRLAAGEGDLWDSGKISGDQASLIEYRGRTLRSNQECFWKVKAWDAGGSEGSWSDPAGWTTGILSPEEWTAEWIGFDEPRRHDGAVPFSGARWIWTPGDKPGDVPAARRYFVRVLDLDSPSDIARADLAATGDDSFELTLNGAPLMKSRKVTDSWKSPLRKDVTPLLKAGRNIFFAVVENAQPGPAGFLFWLQVQERSGKLLTLVSDGSWMSSESEIAGWRAEGPKEGEGKPAAVLGNYGLAPWRLLDGSGLILPPPRYLATRFTVRAKVERALLHASALGACDLLINGRRVSEDRLTPGWTDYAKRVYYRTYDVTRLLSEGKNTLGGILADGWYSGYIGWAVVRDHYGSKTRLKAQLHILYADGSSEVVRTGGDWKAWEGPIRESDLLMGERFDARTPDPFAAGGDLPGGGKDVDTGSEVLPVLQHHPAQPVRVFSVLSPVSITEPRPGAFVFDLGRNFAGVARLKVRGRAGQTVTLRFAERLNPDGTIYVENLRSARATDTYVCRGSGEESWEPRFTFHGFQYVEVTGLTEKPGKETITGVAFSTDTPAAGEFECSNGMLNRLSANILWTQRANFIDVPTDCPQRDERLGWTGDAQIYCRAASQNTDVQAFFHKWLIDLNDAQRADGQFPMVAPLKVAGDDGGPAWADAGVVCPPTIFDVYGDTTILAASYEAMKRFVEFCRNRSTPDLLPPGEFHCFGDWLNVNAETPKEVIYTAYFAHAAQLLARSAGILSKKEDAEKYDRLFDAVRGAFNKTYVDADGRVRGETQTGYVLALAFGLLDPAKAEKAAALLLADIERRGWHLSTGFIGTKDLMLVLSRLSRQDVAYRLLLNETFPSWGFTVKNGATSIWERWDGWTPEKGFQNPEMNSFAHYSFGAVYQWMVENIGGIRSDSPGYGRITLAPVPGGGLTWARIGYRSIRGWIRSSWKIAGGKFKLDVEIPANASATLILPSVAGAVLESGKPVEGQTGIKTLPGSLKGTKSFTLGSGRYSFEYETGSAQ